MIERAISILQQAGYNLTARELAEIFWFAVHIETSSEPSEPSEPSEQKNQRITEPSKQLPIPKIDLPNKPVVDTANASVEATAPVVLTLPLDTKPSTTENREAIPIKIPAAAALTNSLALGRALRPLMRKVPSSTEKILDEEATVQRFAEDKIGIPVLRSTPERWLDIALVVEEASITEIWQQTITEFQRLLKYHGAFRDVRTWKLKKSETQRKIELFPQNSTGFDKSAPYKPDVLIDPKGRRLIILVSDCISLSWREKLIEPVLKLWGERGLITILQLLPERFWDRTALVDEIPVLLSSFSPVVSNSRLITQLLDEDDIDEFTDQKKLETLKSLISIPIITLEEKPFLIWAQVLAGQGNISTAGFKFNSYKTTKNTDNSPHIIPKVCASELVNLFRANASLQARRLAGLMAAVPINISVVNLIQQTLLREDSTQIHVAEVFMSGLLKRLPLSRQDNTDYTYEFVDGVRELLRDFVPPHKQISVIDELSNFIAKRLGLSIKEFEAQLLTHNNDALNNDNLKALIFAFAKIKAQVLRQLGGDYALEAEKLEVFNQLQNFELRNFEFEVATIEPKQSVLPKRKTEFTVERRRQQSQYFLEDLGHGVLLEMVLIKGGSFIMGASATEQGSRYDESPQHQVIIPTFFMGKYPITQTQWKAVAALTKVNRDLEPEPSNFKGDDHPVERVSWYDAVEFCDRLASHTKRQYHLPSEAEWEYACRAGTTTPFHFGETITSELANYNATKTYGSDSKTEYRNKTTPVGSFGVANTFGLYDMHGNVWEWCLDDWHDDYEDAPTDGSPWFNNNDNLSQKQGSAVLRGGSWNYYPEYCRSASRDDNRAERISIVNSFGFRIACGVGNTSE